MDARQYIVAASNGHNTIVKLLIGSGVDLEETAYGTGALRHTDTVLHMAIRRRQLSTVKYLVEESASML